MKCVTRYAKMRTLYFTMNLIERYQKARQEIERRFSGLPYMHTALIGLLLSKAHLSTGIVENITYQDLCDTLMIKAAPGRKDSGIPSKSTLRSVLRTIELTFQNDFKIISEGNHLILQFITLPHFFKKHDLITDQITDQIIALQHPKVLTNTHNTEVLSSAKMHEQITDEITEVSTKLQSKACDLIRDENCDQIGMRNNEETLIKSGKNKNLNCVQMCDYMHEEITDLSTVSSPITLTVNNNKLKTNITTQRLLKSFITEDFYPSDETIRIALKRGLLKVTDLCEIRKFIAYNQQQQSRWADFNPIFIKWLEREHKKNQVLTRKHHERYPIKSSTFELTMQAVLNANKDARAPSESYAYENETFGYNSTHSMAMGTNDGYLWPTVCE